MMALPKRHTLSHQVIGQPLQTTRLGFVHRGQLLLQRGNALALVGEARYDEAAAQLTGVSVAAGAASRMAFVRGYAASALAYARDRDAIPLLEELGEQDQAAGR